MTSLENSGLPSIAILGVGSMGGAILKGVLSKAKLSSPVKITTRSAESAEQYLGMPDVIIHSVTEDPLANAKTVRGAEVVILGVKPAQIPALLTEIASDLQESAIVISVAAGVSLATMRNLLPQSVAVVRAMPNTPSFIGQGVTGITIGDDAAPEALDTARRLFKTVGDVITVDSEAQLDALSAISGSGPAYVFLFIEKLTEAAKNLGFDDATAALLAQKTFLGAVNLLAEEGGDPAELRKQVTSPRGTTEKAIEVFERAELGGLFGNALKAAILRAEELSRGEV